ncbi:MAG: hypothetical protein KDA93_19350 [Planctomycetaceae bacterium]|nr:hypothetical protein [Planctomycetaceae bacterium]
MTKLSLTLLLALAVSGVASFPTTVYAQNDGAQQEQRSEGRRNRGPRGGGPRGGRFGLLDLLRVEEVQKELQLTEDQLTAVESFSKDANEGRPEFPENFREMTEEEQAAFRQKMEEWSSMQNESAKAVLSTLLEAGQYERLTQISIQQRGVAALKDAAIADQLGLSKEQRTKISAAIDESQGLLRSEMQAAFQGGQAGSDRDAIRKKIEELRINSETKVLAELTSDQKTEFVTMQGEAFEMPQRSFGGRGGGRPGGRGRRSRNDGQD